MSKKKVSRLTPTGNFDGKMSKDLGSLCKEPKFFLKIIVLVLCILETSILFHYGLSWCIRRSPLYMSIFCAHAYICIMGVYILAYVFDSGHEFTEKLFLIIGAIMSVVTGIVIFLETSDRFSTCSNDPVTALGVITTASGVVMVIDYLMQRK
ncbi:hypothetical protein PPYR_12605 [Photinus pyralis]|uniref:Uncharacterized protein n=2 Tax=Photinus pyralis TaxID=7054 RepID=A0A5N4A6P1_PHOPY|nr:uncharacterized protein LOC116178020 [Photinus pyralis]KAB0792985.1 hypothetical protein PPYR_12605 [Photinus pyralis]